MKLSKYVIATMCMLVSIVITVQAKSVMQIEEVSSTGALARSEALQKSLIEEQQKTTFLLEQVEIYRDKISEYTKIANEAGGETQIMYEQLRQANIIAGLTDVYGQGVVITMKDSEKANVSGLDENNFVIHDEDILRVINALRDAGAEALSLNGERIVATSEIRCSGATVSVNNNKYASPFVIKAIGNSKELKGALEMRQGVVDILAEWGIQVLIEEKESIVIDAFDGIVQNKYINEVEDEQ